MSDFASAVDDSFGAVPWPEDPKSTAAENEKATAYNGPRDGNWEVSSSIGSCIDDRCPTAYGYSSARPAPGHVNSIGRALAHRLMRAAVEEKEGALAKLAPANAPEKPLSVYEVSPATAKDDVKKPKPFILPRLREPRKKPEVQARETHEAKAAPAPTKPARDEAAAAIEHKTRSADHHVKQPTNSPARSVSVASQQSASGKRVVRLLGKNGEEAFVQLPVRPTAARKASSAMGSAIWSNPASVAAQPALEKTSAIHNGNKDVKQKEQPKSKQEPKQKAVKEAKKNAKQESRFQDRHRSQEDLAAQRSITRLRSTQQFQQQKAEEDRGASTVVSFGKTASAASTVQPASNIPPKVSTKATSVVSTSKDSGIFMGFVKSASSQLTSESIAPGVLSIAQKISKLASSKHSAGAPPAMWDRSEQPTKGIASRHTSVKENDFSASEAASSARERQHTSRQDSRASKPSPDPAHAPESRHNSTRTAYKPPSVQSVNSSSSVEHRFHGFQEVESQEGSRGPIEGSNHTAQQSATVQVLAPVRLPSPASTKSRPSSALERPHQPLQKAHFAGPASTPSITFRNVALPEDVGSQTNFAGTGWISPHPLSPVPREPVVQLPGKGSAGSSEILTYEEWQAKRDEIETVNGSIHHTEAFLPGVAGSRPPAHACDPSAERPIPTMKSDHSSTAMQSQHADQHGLNDHLRALANPQASRHPTKPSQQYQQASVHTHYTERSRGSFSVTHRAPSLQVHRDLPPQVDGLHPDSYNVGFTQNELDNYQHRLEDTVARHSARLSQVQRLQSPSQPDYSAWDRRQSHSPRPPSQYSAQAHSPSLPPYRDENVQLPMPWDVPASVVSSQQDTPRVRSMASSNQMPLLYSSHTARSYDSVRPEQLPHTVLPLRRGFSDTSRHASPAAATVPTTWISCLGSHASQPHGAGPVQLDQLSSSRSQSSVSPQAPLETQSEATFGTGEWQNLEDVEKGFGGFKSRQGW